MPGNIGINVTEFMAGLSEEDRDLFRRVDLGLDIEAFLTAHPVGKFLANMCEIERASAVEALIRAHSEQPTDHQLQKKHHHRIELCDQFKSWMLDAIEVGKDAQRQLQARESTD